MVFAGHFVFQRNHNHKVCVNNIICTKLFLLYTYNNTIYLVTNPLQPIYRQYLPQATAELVTLNMPRQQIIHQRTATPVLVQGVNGQQMIVQG